MSLVLDERKQSLKSTTSVVYVATSEKYGKTNLTPT